MLERWNSGYVRRWPGSQLRLEKDDFSRSQVRILDSGGMIWESDARYETVAEALAAAERALADWSEENL